MRRGRGSKRSQPEPMDLEVETPCSLEPQGGRLLHELPAELLREHILPRLDAVSLVALERTASMFRVGEGRLRQPVTEAVARELLLTKYGNVGTQAARWRNRSWKERLYIEEAACGFDVALAEKSGFRFSRDTTARDAVTTIMLTGLGPKLLVSDVSTAERPLLRWRLRVRGNTAVEFGIVPVSLEDNHAALHKALPTDASETQLAVGFYSQITAGSNLSYKAPVLRGSVVEVIAQRGRLEFIITNPTDSKEMHWVNGQPVSRPYRGPTENHFCLDLPEDYDIRLAVTCWAKGAFDVLHAPGPPATPKLAASPPATPPQCKPLLPATARMAPATPGPVIPLMPDPLAMLASPSIPQPLQRGLPPRTAKSGRGSEQHRGPDGANSSAHKGYHC